MRIHASSAKLLSTSHGEPKSRESTDETSVIVVADELDWLESHELEPYDPVEDCHLVGIIKGTSMLSLLLFIKETSY
jgi:hypothetical protein